MKIVESKIRKLDFKFNYSMSDFWNKKQPKSSKINIKSGGSIGMVLNKIM